MAGPGEESWTLERLRDAVVSPSGLRACAGAALHGMLASAVESVGAGPFGGIARTPGFLRSLEALLDELALGSVSPGSLVEAAERMGTPGARLVHLAKLVQVSTERLAAAGAELSSTRWVTGSAMLATRITIARPKAAASSNVMP